MTPDICAPGPLGTALWSLREDVRLADAGPAVELRTPGAVLRIGAPDPWLRDALHALARGPAALAGLPGTGRPDGLVRLLAVLRRLGGLVVRSVAAGDGGPVLLSVPATAPQAVLSPEPVPGDLPLRLSRFATLRSHDGRAVLESPLSLFRAESARPEAAALLASLTVPATCAAAARRLPLDAGTVRVLVAHLAATGMLLVAQPGPDGPRFAEDDDPVLHTWSPHDLTFHWRSRPGHHDGPVGAAPGPDGACGRPPAHGAADGPRVRLPRAADAAAAMPLREALERRRSVRSHGSRSLTLDQLGALLDLALGDRPQRRYPSGGGSYELEACLSIARCTGLEPGLYRYGPADHVLVRLPDLHGRRARLLAEARTAAGMAHDPDVLLTLTARFARVSHRYRGLAYALTLKHVGVLQQNLYLLTTALGLAGCALGSGDTDLSAAAFGLDWLVESAVGEFVLGSPPEHVRSWSPTPAPTA